MYLSVCFCTFNLKERKCYTNYVKMIINMLLVFCKMKLGCLLNLSIKTFPSILYKYDTNCPLPLFLLLKQTCISDPSALCYSHICGRISFFLKKIKNNKQIKAMPCLKICAPVYIMYLTAEEEIRLRCAVFTLILVTNTEMPGTVCIHLCADYYQSHIISYL